MRNCEDESCGKARDRGIPEPTVKHGINVPRFATLYAYCSCDVPGMPVFHLHFRIRMFCMHPILTISVIVTADSLRHGSLVTQKAMTGIGHLSKVTWVSKGIDDCFEMPFETSYLDYASGSIGSQEGIMLVPAYTRCTRYAEACRNLASR